MRTEYFLFIHHTTSILTKLSTWCYEHSGDISCSLLVNPSHADESWEGRNTCLWIYIHIIFVYIHAYIHLLVTDIYIYVYNIYYIYYTYICLYIYLSDILIPNLFWRLIYDVSFITHSNLHAISESTFNVNDESAPNIRAWILKVLISSLFNLIEFK